MSIRTWQVRYEYFRSSTSFQLASSPVLSAVPAHRSFHYHTQQTQRYHAPTELLAQPMNIIHMIGKYKIRRIPWMT